MHRLSMQWSIALTPVESHAHSGVVIVSAGSSTTSAGNILGWVQGSFRWVEEDVPAPKRVYSPAERVVGIANDGNGDVWARNIRGVSEGWERGPGGGTGLLDELAVVFDKTVEIADGADWCGLSEGVDLDQGCQ